MLCASQHVFRQQVDECQLLRPRILDRVDSAYQTVIQSGVLFFNKARKLRIGGRAPQRNDERLDDGSDNGRQHAELQCPDRPCGNIGGVRQCKTDQERNHRHTQDPSQTSKPKELSPSASYDSDLLEQLFMWRHVMSPMWSYKTDWRYIFPPYPLRKQSIIDTTSQFDAGPCLPVRWYRKPR